MSRRMQSAPLLKKETQMTNEENKPETTDAEFGFVKASDLRKHQTMLDILNDIQNEPPLMKTDDEGVTLFDINFNNHEYFIAWNRINKPNKLLDWILHLTEKDWVSVETISQLILVVADKYKFKIHGA